MIRNRLSSAEETQIGAHFEKLCENIRFEMATQAAGTQSGTFRIGNSSEHGGKGMFATRDLGLQDSIVVVRQPLVMAIDVPRLEDTCYFCQRIPSMAGPDLPFDLKLCAGCRCVRFCNKVSHLLQELADRPQAIVGGRLKGLFCSRYLPHS